MGRAGEPRDEAVPTIETRRIPPRRASSECLGCDELQLEIRKIDEERLSASRAEDQRKGHEPQTVDLSHPQEALDERQAADGAQRRTGLLLERADRRAQVRSDESGSSSGPG